MANNEESTLVHLQTALGYRFGDCELLRTALTHRSHAHEAHSEETYERLEFLGDAVLGLATAEWLYHRYPAEREGSLTRRLSRLVSEPVLAERARHLGLGSALRLGVGEDRSGGRDKASLLADSLEAVVGAIFLDGGWQAAVRSVATLHERGQETPAAADRDAKTRLQELAQRAGLGLPEYRLVSTQGPDHERLFEIECWLGGRRCGTGRGPSKKAAETQAAEAALEERARLDPQRGEP